MAISVASSIGFGGMQLMQGYFDSKSQRRSSFHRLVLWLTMLILVVQLIGMAFHNHSLAQRSFECVSCDLAVVLPAPVTVVPVVILAAHLFFAYDIARRKEYYFSLLQEAYLFPYSQAPPRVFFYFLLK